MKELEGKTALITGGSRGIGAAVALRLAELGAAVGLTYQHDSEQAAAVVDGVKAVGRRALAMRVDNADVEALTAAVDEVAATFGRLDILVNNAAIMVTGTLDELGADEFDHSVAVNVRAPFVAPRQAVRHMTAGGRIISIGSNIAERTVFAGFTLYALSKTANLVHPGPTDTDANPADGPNAETISGLTVLGHYAEPRDIAASVAFLAGENARYITGATINVDGGFAV